ncbi:hypothetical protein BaRGS_00026350 [Batillaria attramentaria]|uniref:Uncharacterized protein n=1 Tax=Batillaria attramentaria TaxID=370345 RepID=A0ABD0K6B2_9CAEN
MLKGAGGFLRQDRGVKPHTSSASFYWAPLNVLMHSGAGQQRTCLLRAVKHDPEITVSTAGDQPPRLSDPFFLVLQSTWEAGPLRWLALAPSSTVLSLMMKSAAAGNAPQSRHCAREEWRRQEPKFISTAW